MAEKVVFLFGASGSGTSTLGKYISDKLKYFFIDVDDYYWLPTDPPFTSKREASQRLFLIKREIERHGGVVISGALDDWGDELIPFFTLAVRLQTDKNVRIERLKKREKTRFGARIDKGGDMYEQHLAFIEWASLYDTGGTSIRSSAKFDEWQKLLPCTLLFLSGEKTLEENYRQIYQKLY